MADIALVHLALDSSGVVAGEKQATRALQNVDCQCSDREAGAADSFSNAWAWWADWSGWRQVSGILQATASTLVGELWGCLAAQL